MLLGLDLKLSFKAGFIGTETITNILLSESDYDINLEFYKYVNGQPESKIGTLHLEELTEIFSQYGLYNLSIDLKKCGLDLKNLFDCFDSGKELVINVTASFNGVHQGKRLNGKFALEILDAEVDADLVSELPSLDMVELFPTSDGTQYINMSSDFMHNPFYADIDELYGYNLDTGQLELIDPSDYYSGSLHYFSDLSGQAGTHTGDLDDIDKLDGYYLELTSDGPKLDYIIDGSYVPRQPDGFDISRGVGNFTGDLNRMDGNYSVFTSNTTIPANVLDPQTVAQPEYITTITGYQNGYGDLGNTHTDDTSYGYIKSKYQSGTPSGYYFIDVDINTPIGNKDAYLSLHIKHSLVNTITLYINGQWMGSDNEIDIDNLLVENLDTIRFLSSSGSFFQIEIFYFEIKEITDFTVFEGTSDQGGDLEFDDNDPTTFSSTSFDVLTKSLSPSGDVSGQIEWDFSTSGGTHFDDIQNDDSFYIQEDAISEYPAGVLDLFKFPDDEIGSSDVVTSIRVWVLSTRELFTMTADLYVTYSSQEILVTPGLFDFAWDYAEWTGLSLSLAQLNSLEIGLKCYNVEFESPGDIIVDQMYIEITYKTPTAVKSEFYSKFTMDPAAQYSDDIDLDYAYEFTGSAIDEETMASMSLDIYNFDTESWDHIEYETDVYIVSGSKPVTEDYYNFQFEVFIRMKGQSTPGFNTFQIELDQLRIYFENTTLEFTTEIYVDNIRSDSALHYSYKVNTSQAITFQIWNDLFNQWFTISSGSAEAFTKHIFSLQSMYFDDNQIITLRFFATNLVDPFKLQIDMLNVDKATFSDEETTGIEDYFVSIDYYSDDSDFYLLYGDDLGYHVLDILKSTEVTTFTARFYPVLCDKRLTLRIIHNDTASQGSKISIDRIFVSSNSTEKINDIIITADTTYDLYYANLKFLNVPSLVDSHMTSVPLAYIEPKGNYYVFKISDIDTERQFIIDQVKFISPRHCENITVIPQNYYHVAGDEIYIDSAELRTDDIPLFTPESEFTVDYSYIYDSWEEDEYVDTQPYVHNFSISAAQRIEAVSFMVSFSEIPQIQSWFFGTAGEETVYKQLSNQLIKNVNLLEIQLFDFVSDTWEVVNYVA
ncbi:hypothetical protein ES705_28952 [subsurface metagenome]